MLVFKAVDHAPALFRLLIEIQGLVDIFLDEWLRRSDGIPDFQKLVQERVDIQKHLGEAQVYLGERLLRRLEILPDILQLLLAHGAHIPLVVDAKAPRAARDLLDLRGP